MNSTKYRKLGVKSQHRKAMLKNLTVALFRNEKIETTLSRAKVTQKFAERMITLSKKGGLHRRRLAFSFLRDDEMLHKLFTELAERYKERNGGYTRIVKTAIRRGDSSSMAIIELV